MKNKKVLIGVGLVVLMFVLSFFLKDYLTLENAKTQQETISDYMDSNFLLYSALFFMFYVIVTALSIPGAAVITLLGGALFGFWYGLILVSFASTIGATCAFIVSRYIAKDWVREKFADKLKIIDDGIEKDGLFYLFSLRLIPLFPFFLINILFGLTNTKTLNFYIVSQVGMLLGTMVYVNAGTQLSTIESLSDIVSFNILLSFVLLGLFPILAKFILKMLKK